MNRRSRKGCIDCKRAKVKCDEVHPTCGTCYRRGYVCQGYKAQDPQVNTIVGETGDVEPLTRQPSRRCSPFKKKTVRAHSISPISSSSPSSGSEAEAETVTPFSDRKKRQRPEVFSPNANHSDERGSLIALSRGAFPSQIMHHAPLCLKLPAYPPGTIQIADEPGVEVYFKRHPTELVISSEFIEEMNSNVLQVFHDDPAAVAETLSAIGHVYMGEGGLSIVPVLDRKARILARLRARRNLEQMLIMILGLCALELIDHRSEPEDISLVALVANAAMIIKHNQESGSPFSSVAKYFIRALARQDMMISLTYARHPLISSEAWLEGDPHQHADRFMGYTGSLMPILASLGALAEELREQPADSTLDSLAEELSLEQAVMLSSEPMTGIYQRAAALRTRLSDWRPIAAQNISFQSSRNLLFHAHSYRAASLIYLHRLLEPPGSSEAADQAALGMAHEVLMHLSAMTDQLKTALWPVLIAGTELFDQEDRDVAIQMFDEIFSQRKTITALRTKNFCVNRVWAARDTGMPWNWMDLVLQYPGECLPI